jgi:carbohydrate-binding DOMON domain-containing protein
VDSQEVPLAESTELYEMDIFNGANVVRTLSSVTPSLVYTSAQQVADFGSAQASVSVRLYQMSSIVGRGKPCIATL